MRIVKKNLYESKRFLQVMLLCLSSYGFLPGVGVIRMIYMLLVAACLLIVSVNAVLSKPVSKARIWIFFCYGLMFFSTAVGPGSMYDFLSDNVRSFTLCLVLDLWLTNNPGMLLSAYPITQLLGYINLVDFLLFSDSFSWYRSYGWLLGHKSQLLQILLPSLTMSLICSYWRNGRISRGCIVYFLCCWITLILSVSVTSLIAFSIFTFLFLIYQKVERPLPSIFRLKTAILVNVVFVAALLFQTDGWDHSIHTAEALFNKGASFAWRINLWKSTIELIKERPLLGYGHFINDRFAAASGVAISHPHSAALFILLSGGGVLAAVVLYGYWKAHMSLRKNEENIYARIILFALIAYLTVGIADLDIGNRMFVMLVIGMHASDLAKLPPPSEYTAGFPSGRSRKRELHFAWGRRRIL